jgi:hypothetical protein
LNSKGIATNLLFPPVTTSVGKGGGGNIGLKSLAAAAFQQSSTGFGGNGNSRAKGGKKGGRSGGGGAINPILLNYSQIDDLPLSQETLQQQQSNYSSPLRYNPGATANEVATSLISMNDVVRKRLREEYDGGKGADDSADEVDTVTNSSVAGDKVQQQAKKKPKRRSGR